MPGLNFRGTDLVNPINRLKAGFCALASNVRSYIKGGFTLRNPLSSALFPVLPSPPHTIRRLNDSTPNGPPGGYTLIIGAGEVLYAWNPTIGTLTVATGLSGNPLSMIPFRPNASVQPWMYIGDAGAGVDLTLAADSTGGVDSTNGYDSTYAYDSTYIGYLTSGGTAELITKYLISGDPVTFPSNGMIKVRSDGLCYKMGIKEPQVAPVVSTANSNVPFGGVGALLATAIPWTNYAGQNTGGSSPYNYGESEGPPNPTPPIDGTPPFIIDCLNANTITIFSLAPVGTITVNGTPITTQAELEALSSGRVASNFPGGYIQTEGSPGNPPTASYVVGAFTDGAGNVIPAGVAPLYISNIVDVGLALATNTPIPVPFGAVAFQVGLNSQGNTFSANSGAIDFEGNVNTDALPTVLSILGTLALSYWGDSPSSGPVGSYIWKNSGDSSGSGPVRSNTAANGSTSGNSFIFDATFTGGIPGLPGVGMDSLAMQWTSLNPDSVATGAAPVFPAPLITTYPTQTIYANFNFCLTGSIYVPAAGNYTFVLTSHDDTIWGIKGATLISATQSGSGEGGGTGLSGSGQTLTALNGYPLLPRQNYTNGEGGNYAQTTVVVNFSQPGIYPIEIDYDYWFHSGRILLLEGSPMPGAGATIIPPLPANTRQNTQYRYTYRSSATGATSNPSPESAPETIPVNANTITSLWSPDPQVDVVDYYRIDSVVADYTYVATGPNDDLGATPGTNTGISDSLTDTQLGTQLINFDNFEPFPSIDLPQKGICSISGGVITWISGGAIGGTATGFNLRWLGGTEILIGSPTSLAYTFIARPTTPTTITIPGVADATDAAYYIPEPILGAQPLAYLFGPTDNINFTFGVGDPLRPGTLYWCAGSNLDAAPDTNQFDVTDPSEALVNGAMSAGRGVLFSIRRAWIIAPNFFNALATATGTQGSTWSLKATAIDRGLFIPRCLCVSGGGLIYFRVDDGIHVSNAGSASKSITDETIYPIFPHEGGPQTAITRQGFTFYPPDDTQPNLQKFAYQNGYMYYDYYDVTGVPRTICWDEAAMGWVLDVMTPQSTVHAPDEGESIQGCLVGCGDGSVRQFVSSVNGAEVVTGTVVTPAIGGRGYLHFMECTVEYQSTATVNLAFIAADEGNGSYAPNPVVLPSTLGLPNKYTFKVSPNKWKWLQCSFQSFVPGLQVYLEGFSIEAKEWGVQTEYVTMLPFASGGGEGAQP